MKKLNWNHLDMMCIFIGRINKILEEKYPENPYVNYVAAKLGDELGDDAWAVLHQNYAEYFPSISDIQRVEIGKVLRQYLDDKKIYLTDWDIQAEDVTRETKLIKNINYLITKNYSSKPDIHAIAHSLVYTLGYDAWRALTVNPETDFPLLDRENRNAIATQLLKYIKQSGSYFTLWDKYATIEAYIIAGGDSGVLKKTS